jgi:hypothetical protein
MQDNDPEPLSLIEMIEQVLVEDDWHYERDEERDVVMLGVKCRNASLRLAFDAKEDKGVVVLYGLIDGRVPQQKLVEAAEFITRANYGLLVGNFEMDYGDGEVRFKVSVDVEGAELTPTMIRNMINYCVVTLNRYYPGLMGVLFGNLDPAEAAAEAEASEDDDHVHGDDCDHEQDEDDDQKA